MKAIIQRVKKASVTVAGSIVSSIDQGILTLIGIEAGDSEEKIQKHIRKICDLRIFPDEQGKMNLSLRDIKGEHLIVSQFTLAGVISSGNRPSFSKAEKPEQAKILYEYALDVSKNLGIPTLGGVFQAHMEIDLINDGPVTFILE